MNLIQLGTTASRANRGKSVNRQYSTKNGASKLRRKWWLVSLIPEICLASYPERGWKHASN